MQYEKAYAELVVFGNGDFITTSRGGGLDSSEEWDDYDRVHRPTGTPSRPGMQGRPGGGHRH